MMSAANDIPSAVESAAFDAAAAAVAAALAAGARYADARLVDRRHESLTARDGDLRSLTQTTSAGLGVRALVGSSWGFAALGDPAGGADARATGARATAIAAAPAAVAPRGGGAGPAGRARRRARRPGHLVQRLPRGPLRRPADREGRPAHRCH